MTSHLIERAYWHLMPRLDRLIASRLTASQRKDVTPQAFLCGALLAIREIEGRLLVSLRALGVPKDVIAQLKVETPEDPKPEQS